MGREECDDGNGAWYDGCSGYCNVECGFTCTGGGCGAVTTDTCSATCGDGVMSYYVEDCDDGNNEDGDGCSSECTVETGWQCWGWWCGESQCDSICGDGLVIGSEECDDGNWWSYDGCSGSCQVECGWTCDGGECTGVCGDGMRRGTEECDDGNVDPLDGCSATCAVLKGFYCFGALPYWKCGGSGDQCSAGCGSGTRSPESAKECDDGNSINGDGCSGACRIECGWTCAGGNQSTADSCFELIACGDGFRASSEECDDGNQIDGDGCSSSCGIELGFSCLQYPVLIYPCGSYVDWCSPVCGDGRLVGSEIGAADYCDDGNVLS